jgi:hypothetical protein
VLRDAPPEVMAALRRTATEKGGLEVGKALGVLDAHQRWDEVVKQDASDGTRQIFFSKEVNQESIKKTAQDRDDVKRNWVFGGAGGNAVSGAEIILASTTKAEVTMVARDQPAGLFQNGQFRSLAERHGDATVADYAKDVGVVIDAAKSTKRLHLVIDGDLNLITPKLVTGSDGAQKIELWTKDKKTNVPSTVAHQKDVKNSPPVIGDMFVSALGSPGQLPPEIGALALEARRKFPPAPEGAPKQGPVWVEADFATDGRYRGYFVHIRMGAGYRRFEVRGAASRPGFVRKANRRSTGCGRAEKRTRIQRVATSRRGLARQPRSLHSNNRTARGEGNDHPLSRPTHRIDLDPDPARSANVALSFSGGRKRGRGLGKPGTGGRNDPRAAHAKKR